MTRSIEFFDRQFSGQAGGAPPVLNPFETLVLPHLKGSVLDLGCGLGALSLAAARAGCTVLAVDAGPAAVAHVKRAAAAEGLAVTVRRQDLSQAPDLGGPFDAVVAIGLLMFLDRSRAYALLGRMQAATRPGGLLALNVLVAGTTWREALDPAAHHLFEPEELLRALAGWPVLERRDDAFPAPGDTQKRFVTILARRPLRSAACG